MKSQRGVIPLALLILIGGLLAGIYLVQQTQIFNPRAMSIKPTSPETSFYLVEQARVKVPQCPVSWWPEGLDFVCPQEDANQNMIAVTVYARSDIEAANLFSAQLTFPTDLLEVVAVKINTATKEQICPVPDIPPGCTLVEIPPVVVDTNECIKYKVICDSPRPGENCVQKVTTACKYDDESGETICEEFPTPCDIPGGWIEQTQTKSFDEELVSGGGGGIPGIYFPGFIKNIVDQSYDNSAGTISLVGGVPDPGYKTEVSQPLYPLGVIVFTTKKEGKSNIGFTPDSAIYSNQTNENILKIVRGIDIDTTVTEEIVVTCKGSISVEQLKKELTGANYPGPWDNESMVAAYNNAACPEPVTTCKGEVKTFEELTKELQVANYPGPWKREDMIAAYNRAACPDVVKPLPNTGDANGDGKINLIDLSILLSDFNKTGSVRKGIDMNGDGKINTFDFSLMRNILIEHKIIKG